MQKFMFRVIEGDDDVIGDVFVHQGILPRQNDFIVVKDYTFRVSRIIHDLNDQEIFVELHQFPHHRSAS